jgi:hypothetical protein
MRFLNGWGDGENHAERNALELEPLSILQREVAALSPRPDAAMKGAGRSGPDPNFIAHMAAAFIKGKKVSRSYRRISAGETRARPNLVRRHLAALVEQQAR